MAFWEVGGITQSIPQNSCGHMAIRYGTNGGHHHCPICQSYGRQTLLPVRWHKAGTTLGPSRRCHEEQAGKRPSQLPWSLGLLPDHQLPVPWNWERAGQGVLSSAGLHADSLPTAWASALVLAMVGSGMPDEFLRRSHLLPEALWGGGDEPCTGELVTYVSPSCSAPTEREISGSGSQMKEKFLVLFFTSYHKCAQ